MWKLHVLRHAREGPGEQIPNNGVVARVRILDGVMDQRPLLARDVRTADEFDSEAPILLLCQLQVPGDVLRRAFEVRLEGVVYQDSAVTVILPHEIDGPGVDCVLEDLLLGVDPETRALLGSLVAYFCNGCF